MKKIPNNCMNQIFEINDKGNYLPKIKSLKNISQFFNFLKNSNNSQESKSAIINDLSILIKKNRFISEYFSSFENIPIYFFLFDLYLNKDTNEKLKQTILNLIKELISNIETNKNIYEYLYQKLSLIYHDNKSINFNLLYNILTLLNNIMGEIENIKPRNYFCCNGEGKFEINISNLNIGVGNTIAFILNFKVTKFESEKIESNQISNLLK